MALADNWNQRTTPFYIRQKWQLSCNVLGIGVSLIPIFKSECWKTSNLQVNFETYNQVIKLELQDNIVLLNSKNPYIDCFNGETIEHFISNSAAYDIIIFEPDPLNYQLSIDTDLKDLGAIDFSSWLARLVKHHRTKIHVKISMSGTEVQLLEKMILDNILLLVDRHEIEWTDRHNTLLRARRSYVQLMLDSYGYDCLYSTRLEDTRKVFQLNRTFDTATKYFDWENISQSITG
ncbi:unnamed protein product [Rotaria socialis]|uniref:Uncharacterized protein n=1 Tax=Rotaria socialis TaxID=392032 RepID=A0A820S3L6_9BILA|nr:unnamed protein product [Rotaria socialis]CAF4445729.1 unnamed protein product [Rotaria socialis]